MSYQNMIIVGRLGAEPESRAFPNGGSICMIRVATSESWRDKASGEKREHTEWHRCVLRNRLGEIAQQYLHKGDQVLIEGQLRTRKWQDQSGEDRFTTELIADEMKMLEPRGGSGQNHDQNQQYNANNQKSSASAPHKAGGGSPMDDDIPFQQIDTRIY